MLFNRIRFILFLIVINVNFIYGQQLSDFVNLSESIPSLVVSLRYGTSKNFLGRVVKGYENPKPLGTSAMAEALQCVQKKLKKDKSISHCFFNRLGGKSKGIYKSLNCGPGSNDYKTKIN